jgi:hypothetical protein
MLRSRAMHVLGIIVITVALAFAAQATLADEADTNVQPQGEEVVITRSGGAIAQVQKISNTAAATRTATTWAILARTVIVIPAGQPPSFLDMRFSGESTCYGGGNDFAWCSLRILVDGVEANPVVGIDFAFDSTNEGRETGNSWESHAIERYSNCLQPGQHIVTVEWASRDFNAAPPTFRLDDWTLAVERVRGCR